MVHIILHAVVQKLYNGPNSSEEYINVFLQFISIKNQMHIDIMTRS